MTERIDSSNNADFTDGNSLPEQDLQDTFATRANCGSWGVNGALTPPIGAVVAWLKTYTNTPALPAGWAECDGSTVSDSDSPYDGQTLPDLNGDNRFLRGSSTSGSTGGSETHSHAVPADPTGSGPGGAITGGNTSADYYDTNWQSDATSTLPTYYEVVWIIRIK